MTNFSVQQRVAKGVALLDEHGPADWRSKLDFNIFDITEPSRCVLGQLYGRYTAGLSVLESAAGDGWFSALEHGFDSGNDERSAFAAEWSRVARQTSGSEPTFTLSELRALRSESVNMSGFGIAVESLIDSRDPAKQKVTVELTREQWSTMLIHGVIADDAEKVVRKALA